MTFIGKNLYRVAVNGEVRWATARDAKFWTLLDGDPYGKLNISERMLAKDTAALRLPVTPGKIIGVGENFRQIGAGSARGLPSLFFMPPSALVLSRTKVKIPDLFNSLAVEGELGVVLKSGGRYIPEAGASERILGYTVVNDFSGREPRLGNTSSGLKKSCDGFLPIGPSLLLEDGVRDFRIRTYLNGKLCHDANTRDMTHSIAEVIAFASQYITLEAGDLICMGAVDPKPFAGPGDTVRIEIEGMDVLETELS